MKLRPVTKFVKKNKKISKILNDNVMITNCGFIVIFPIYGQFEAIQKAHFRCLVCITYISIKCNFLSYKN